MPGVSFQSRALGVTHDAVNSPFNSISPDRAPLRVFRPPSTSATVGVGVGQCARPLLPPVNIASDRDRPACAFEFGPFRLPLLAASLASGVGQCDTICIANPNVSPAPLPLRCLAFRRA